MVPPQWPRHTRDLEGTWLAIEDIRERIDSMQIADEVTERVRREIEEHRMFGFTALQKIAAAVVGCVATASLILQIVQSAHG